MSSCAVQLNEASNNNDKNFSNENGLDSDVSEKISQSEDLESTAEEISQN